MISFLSSRSLFRLRIVLPLLGLMFAFPPLALLIVSSPLGFGIVFPKAAWFFYYGSEGCSVCAMSFRRWFPSCPPAARFAYCSAAVPFPYVSLKPPEFFLYYVFEARSVGALFFRLWVSSLFLRRLLWSLSRPRLVRVCLSLCHCKKGLLDVIAIWAKPA